ncbi:hypothetical protein niasHS_007304 [Heterodera schachtii]|uniref:SH3 domain-containing protein n=1 Tax=Heterodera schachtii TaxID=97005 RepID=A0ABD2JJZ6_HETSC
MEGDPTFVNVQPNFVQQNLRELLDSHLPNQIARFEESSVNLERVAAFCEANYLQSPNKAEALAETKRCALQSLASFAFMVGDLSRSLLSALELESLNLSDKTSQIQNIAQFVSIQKEKSARREIGKLTANKNLIRLNKITYPSSEERTPRYHRTPIDFAILDGIGHGKRLVQSTNDYGTIGAARMQGTYSQITLNRTGSMVSSGRTTTGGAQNQQPIYEHYARANYGTLSRGSSLLPPPAPAVSSLHDQYRVPMPIPSSVVPPPQQPFTRSIQCSQHFPAAQCAPSHHNRNHSMGRADEMTDNALVGGDRTNGRFQQNHYGSANNGQCTAEQTQQQNQHQQQHYEPIGSQMEQQIANHLDNQLHLQQQQSSNNSEGRMNNSADFSDDGLPLPPPLLLSNAVAAMDQHSRLNQRDDAYPPPPNRPGLNAAIGGELPNWVPQHYIEEAVVLYNYDSQNSDELRLYQGALVYVLRKNDDGWFEGVMDGTTGLFPGNYVRPIQ